MEPDECAISSRSLSTSHHGVTCVLTRTPLPLLLLSRAGSAAPDLCSTANSCRTDCPADPWHPAGGRLPVALKRRHALPLLCPRVRAQATSMPRRRGLPLAATTI